MPEDITHSLQEDLSTTSWQSFCSKAQEPPTLTTIKNRFCFPLDIKYRYMASDISAIRKPSPMELLPVELFEQIILHLAIDTPTNGYTPRNKDLASCLLVSRTFYNMTLSTLYARVAFPHSSIFSKFLAHINTYPELGELVRRLDFSQFTSIGLGRTRRMNSEILNLTSTTLLNCLNLTPLLREFLAAESMDEDIDAQVLSKLFFDLPLLQSVDFCGSTTPSFVKDITCVLSANNPQMPESLGIKRVGFHGCTTLPSSVFSTMIPRLSNLTHLDLTHTQITETTLHSLPVTARLTHLSLSKCSKLKGPAVVDFLTTHPAVKGLVYLNLHYDTSRYRLLSTADVDNLLPYLPHSLSSLNLSGAKINSYHIPHLRRLASHVEELSIGSAELSMEDICMLFRKGDNNAKPHQSVIQYLDLTGISSVTPISLLLAAENDCLLGRITFPLRVLELSEKVTDGLKERKLTGSKLGWVVKSQNRRGWYVRDGPGIRPGGEDLAIEIKQDDGSRSWKMGGKWWGSRKIGMARGEVSGIYGYYAFGK